MEQITTLFKEPEGELKAGNARERLNFEKFKAKYPELGFSAAIMRSRARKLEVHFLEDSHWAKKWFFRTSVLSFLAVGVAFGIGIYLAVSREASLAWTFLVAAFVGAALGLGCFQSLGWHKRFGALFAARWAMTALVTRIDQDLVRYAFLCRADGALDAETRALFHADMRAWADELGRALSAFGVGYGAALTPLTLPEFKIPK